uniref:chaperonin GroEL n=1 Tax=Haramonas pauciplastida TaxID=478668 RepID=UPI0021155FF2|nr:chaperonin GroEL [Haramonas pauciplastida]UTE94936.1 chaperonin GroEL [Haramonas pauciplastida]
MNKKILYQEEARRTLEKGMKLLANAVSITLGPRGRNVVIENKFGSPEIINDGITIAKQIKLKNNIENTGVSLIRQAAAKTNEVAGDGTTTATVLAYSIVKQGMRNIAAGANSILLKKGIEKAINFLVMTIANYSKPIESVHSVMQIASISAGGDEEPAQIISQVLSKVGKDYIISLEEGNSTSTTLEISEGMNINKGFISPYFATNLQRMEAIYENAYVLITNKKIAIVQQDLIPILEQVRKSKRPLLIIAADIEKEALATLVLNKLKNILNVIAIRAPGLRAQQSLLLEDIAVLTNGQLITEEAGLSLENVSLKQLGIAKKVIVTKDNSIIISEGNQDVIRLRCQQLQKQADLAETQYDKSKLEDRIAKLVGGVAVVKVGAVTETEMKDKKLRLEDAINATRAAVEEGVVPGGGSILAHLSEPLKTWAKNNLVDDELVGALVVSKAILEPLKKIAENSGKNGSVILQTIQEKDIEYGYNAANNSFGNMYTFGIIDPSKVTRSALQNASSIASMILTTECLIVNKNK